MKCCNSGALNPSSHQLSWGRRTPPWNVHINGSNVLQHSHLHLQQAKSTAHAGEDVFVWDSTHCSASRWATDIHSPRQRRLFSSPRPCKLKKNVFCFCAM